MGGHDEVIALEQGGVEASALGQTTGGQLVLHHVGGVTADPAGLQGLVHILLVDDAAAAHVQDNGVVLHLGDGLGIEQVAGLIVQRHMDGDEVRNLQHLVDAHALGVLLLEDVSGQIGVVSDDVHLEHAGQLAHALADAAKAQNAQGLAPQLAAHELILVPLLVDLHVVAGGNGMAGQVQHLGDGQLGHGVAVQAGGVDDLHALLLGVVQVDVVQTHGADADDLQVLGGIQDLLVDGGVHAHDENVILGDQLGQLVLARQHFGVHGHVFAQFLGDGAVDGVDDKTFHS